MMTVSIKLFGTRPKKKTVPMKLVVKPIKLWVEDVLEIELQVEDVVEIELQVEAVVAIELQVEAVVAIELQVEADARQAAANAPWAEAVVEIKLWVAIIIIIVVRPTMLQPVADTLELWGTSIPTIVYISAITILLLAMMTTAEEAVAVAIAAGKMMGFILF